MQGYTGPCPPSGTHRYLFQLSAVSQPLVFGQTPDAARIREAMSGTLVGTARLTGTYTRP